jgi:ABC-type sugar transport system permease subunit
MGLFIAIMLSFIIFQLMWQNLIRDNFIKRLNEYSEEQVEWGLFNKFNWFLNMPIWITITILVSLIIGSQF